MKHYGDITKIQGDKVPLVDIICGGSPCQDLSVAGRRKGLSGERSGLFMEQIRVIKELRNESIKQLRNRGSAFDIRCVQPRYMVWENVPGAFSSNKGEDFKAVLEETAKIADINAVIPRLENTKWSKSGCILADGWSIAWRVHDAQFWGVPQRRKRIALVADFAGQSAPEILFESKSLQGDFGESNKTWEETTYDIGRNLEKTGSRLNPWDVQSKSIFKEDGVVNSLCSGTTEGMNIQPCVFIENKTYGVVSKGNGEVFIDSKTHTSLTSGGGQAGQGYPCVMVNEAIAFRGDSITSPINSSNPKPGDPCHTLINDGRNYVVEPAILESNQNHAKIYENGICSTLPASMGMGGGYTPMIVDSSTDRKNRTPTLVVDQVKVQGTDIYNGTMTGDVAATLNAASGNSATHSGPSVMIQQAQEKFTTKDNDTIAFQGQAGAAASLQLGYDVSCTLNCTKEAMVVQKTTGSLCASGYEKLGTQEVTNDMYVISPKSLVRRLTPLECERLQGYPDGWTDIGEWVDTKGKKHKDADSPRYKALGNSIALPFWEWMADRMVNVLKKDGVENPTMASLFDGIGGFALVYSRCGCQPVWASEIEEFPIAVTKRRFPESEDE